VRAFLAVPVTPPAFDPGVRLIERLATAMPGVRWVRSDGLHLTLHFFGDLPDDAVPLVVDAARIAARKVEPYTAQLGGLGCFPRDGDERVLWIGMQQGEGETAALQRDVEDALSARGFPREPRAFRPHVTLGRPRERFTEAVRRRWAGFAAESLPPFAVEELRLFRSQLGPGGSRYEVLERAPLGDRLSPP
jgi:RNA 2',3'-cyclic 3'-phosphodiesterase